MAGGLLLTLAGLVAMHGLGGHGLSGGTHDMASVVAGHGHTPDTAEPGMPTPAMKRRLTLMALALVAALTLTACGTNNDGGAPPADTFNDADVTFAQAMIPHHRQAVQMANMARANAATDEVHDLAVKIEAAQQPEIDLMTAWLTTGKKPVPTGFGVTVAVGLLTAALTATYGLVASWARGYLAAVAARFVIVFAAQIISAVGYGAWFPWAVPSLLSGVAGPDQAPPGVPAITSVAVVGLVAGTATALWWQRADQDR